MISLSLSQQKTQVAVITVMEPWLRYTAAAIALRAGLTTPQAAAALHLLKQKSLVVPISDRGSRFFGKAATRWSLTGVPFEIPGFRKLGETEVQS